MEKSSNGMFLCTAGQVIVEAEQHQLGHRRAAGVQIAQMVMNGTQLVARKIERARSLLKSRLVRMACTTAPKRVARRLAP